MKLIFKILAVFLLIANFANGQNISNKGKDFWVGYGYHQYMATAAPPIGGGYQNDQNMTVYISVEALPAGKSFATVVLTVDSSDPNPSLWWRREYRIPANKVISIDDPASLTYLNSFSPAATLNYGPIPKGQKLSGADNAPVNQSVDFRLYNANGCPNPVNPFGMGLFKGRGIHLTSDVDIVAFAHIYGGANSGATMLLPTSSWGYSYTTINSTQINADFGNGFFFIIANEDSTVVKITASQPHIPLTCVNHTAQQPYIITLNKGEIYQYVGQLNPGGNNSGVQLTGSKIESIPNSAGKCKKIAVFAGCGRTGGETSASCGFGGRDNDMQQCFPEHTWGTYYLTAPFADGGTPPNACAQQGCVYKVVAKDTGTYVRFNGAPAGGVLIPPYSFVTFSGATGSKIEGTKPIAVAQFMTGGNCGGGDGDPEMIYLSPVDQAITNVNFYRNTQQDITSNFVNIIIPDSGLSTLKINGLDITTNFGGNSCVRVHPQDARYKIVVKGWVADRAQVSIKADVRFNTITYGMGGPESYGYSGGTYLNNLAAVSKLYNTLDTPTIIRPANQTHSVAYNLAPVELKSNIAYEPKRIDWLFSLLAKNPELMDTNKITLQRICDGVKWQDQIDTQRSYFFTPSFQFQGYDTFYIKGCDTNNTCTTNMHIIQVGTPLIANTSSVFITRANGAPFTGYNTTTQFNATGGNIGYRYTVFNSNGTPNVTNKGGTVTVGNVSGLLSYTAKAPPGINFNGRDTFFVRLCDNGGVGATNCVTKMYVLIIGTQFSIDNVVIRNSTSVNTSLTNNAALELNTVGGRVPYTYQLVDVNGIVTTTSAAGAALSIATSNYTYTPINNFTGIDSFYIRVTDNNNPQSSAIQKHIITVGGVFAATTTEVNNFTTLNKSYKGLSSDNLKPSGGIGSYIYSVQNIANVANKSNKNCSVTINANNGIFNYTPNTGLIGSDSFYVKVCDANNVCFTQLYIVNILPTFVATTVTINENTNNSSTLNGLSANQFNATGGKTQYAYSIVNSDSVSNGNKSNKGANVSINSSTGNYQYNPIPGFIGVDSFYVRINDSCTSPNGASQLHIVSVYPSIIGNTLPFLHAILKDKTFSGNIYKEMPNIQKISLTRFIAVNQLGQPTGTTNRGGTIDMVPLSKDTIIDPIQGNKYVYKALPTYIPDCKYMFIQKNNTIPRIDTIYLPMVLYSKQINGLPTGCFGAGGVVGDTINLQYIIYPDPKIFKDTMVVKPSCPTDSMITFKGNDSSTVVKLGNIRYVLPATKWYWRISGIFKGNPITYIDDQKIVSHPFDTGTIVKINLVTIFKNGAVNYFIDSFKFTTSKIAFDVKPKEVCIGQAINLTDITFSSTGLDSFYWNMGNGKDTLSFIKTYQYTYPAPGKYVISHKVKINGCNAIIPPVTDTVIVAAKRYPKIVAPLNCIDTSGKADFSYDNSGGGVGIKDYAWTFSNATNTSILNTSIINPTVFNAPKEDDYTVKLYVKDSTGCDGDTTIKVAIHIKPNIIFKPFLTGICVNGSAISIKDSAACLNKLKVGGYGKFTGQGITDTLGTFNPNGLTPGNYTIWYTYFSGSSLCSDSIPQQITVWPKPSVDFDYTPKGCLPKTGVAIFANNTVDGFNFLWNFDDAANTYYTNNPSIVDSVNPTHRFYNTGSHNVKLFSETDKGCKDSTTKTITFTVTPNINYPALTSVCQNQTTVNVNTATFSNGVNSSSVLGSYSGNGVTSAGVLSPAVSGFGNQTVTYIADLAGCRDTATQTILIKARPILGFTYPVGCLPSSGVVNFTDTSKMPDAQSIQSCAWTFGDPGSGAANTSIICSPQHTYSYGTYNIYHSVTSSLGCMSDTTFTATFSISPDLFYNTIPAVCESDTTHSVKYAGSNNLPVAPGSGVYKGPGVIDAINGIINPRLLGAGTHKIYYEFTATSGCVKLDSQTVVVKGAPRGKFTFSPPGCLPSNGVVQFNALGITVSGSSISTYSWNFGNTPNLGTGINPSNTYNDGTYLIKLTVTANNGCVYDTSMTQTFNKTPSIDFLNINDTCENTLPFSLNAIGKAPAVLNGVVGVGSWSDNKGAITDTATGMLNPSIVGYGPVTITYKYSTPGCFITQSQTITILGRPKGTITYTPYKTCLPTTGLVDFDASSYSAAGSSINTYAWVFNNTSTGLSYNGSIVKPQAILPDGNYTIKLTTTASNGCSFDTTILDTFKRLPLLQPIVQAAICTNGGVVPLQEPLPTNGVTGTGVFTSYKNAINPAGSLNYDPAISGYGWDTLYYTFVTTNGCQATEKLAVEVKSRPTGQFTFTPAQGICLDTTGKVTFDASNIIAPGYGIQSYNWSLGKYGPANGVSPIGYFAEGKDSIKLRIYSTNNCWFDTAMEVNFGKTANISPFAIQAICSNGTVVPIPNPSILNGVNGTGVFTSYKNAVVPVNLYDPNIAGPGKDTLYYNFTSTNGCPASQKFVVEVKPKPIQTSLSVSPTSPGCLDTTGIATFSAVYTLTGGNISNYNWNYGNTTPNGNGATTTVKYDEGTYKVKLMVTGDNQCTTEDSISVTFGKKPNLSALLPIDVCENDLSIITLTAPSVLNQVNGSGVFSSYKGAATAAGIYNPATAGFGDDTLYYTFTSNGGCATTVKVPIYVKEKPVGSFTVTPPSGSCLDTSGTATFNANYGGNIATYNWDFDNFSLGYGFNTTTVYKEGTYKIKLTVTGNNTCSIDDFTTVTFGRKPNLGPLQTFNICENGTTRNLVPAAVLNGVNGAGVFSSFKGAATAAGVYDPKIAGYGVDTIYYKFTSIGGCDTTVKVAITVDARPYGTFSYTPSTGCLNTLGTVTLTANINVPNSSVQTYTWNYGDNTLPLGNGKTVSHDYLDGTYTINLSVTGNNGCKNDTSLTTTFNKLPDLGVFAQAPVCENGGNIFLVAPSVLNGVLGTGVFSSNKGAIVNATSGEYNPSIAAYGKDTITYTFTSSGINQCQATKTLYLNILASPKGTFSYLPVGGCLDTTGKVSFDASGITVSGSSAKTFIWDFESPSKLDTTKNNKITHYYSDGTYDIKLKVIGNNGCRNDFSMLQQKFSKKPNIDAIVINQKICGNSNPIFLTPPSVLNNVAGAPGVFSSYKNNITGNAVSGFYYNPIVANYILDTIYYDFVSFNGCSTQVKKPIVINPVPKVKLQKPTNICQADSFILRDVSTVISGAIDSSSWVFVDTTINKPIDRQVIYHFDDAGVVGIRLTVASDSGCLNSDTFSINVRPLPVANFKIASVVCMPNGTAYFNNYSSIDPFGGTLKFNWNFGDVLSNISTNNLNTSTKINTEHTYASIANYVVKLTATSNEYGCKAFFEDTVKNLKPFYQRPSAWFYVDKDTVCEDEPIRFIDTASSAPGSSLFRWTWTYGDNSSPNTTIIPTSTYAYNKTNITSTFNASLTVRSTELCESKPFYRTIVVYKKPRIDSLPLIYAVDGSVVMFNPKVNDSNNVTFTWSGLAPYYTFGFNNVNALHPQVLMDLNTALGNQTALVTNKPVTYQLTAEGQFGCADTAYQVVKILGKLNIPNAFSPNNDNKNDFWEITSLGDYPNARADIYDRYGNKVVTLSGQNMKWDGKINGSPAAVATYYYIITPGNGVAPITGWVMLLK